MKNFYLTLILVAFASFLFVKCDSDDDGEVIEDVIEDPGPFDLEREFGGADAINILTETDYTSLTIEFAYSEGNRPKQTSLDELKAFINERAHKSGGITYVETVIPAPSGAPFTYLELEEIEEEHRTQFRSGTNLAFWILMVNDVILNEDGTNDTNTLAAVYYNTSMYLSIPTITTAAEDAPISGYDGMESSTLQHEFGHWMGLVNTLETGDTVHPTKGEHEDTENKGHCKVETCLMYWGSNNPFHGGYVSRLQSGFLVELGDLCKADLVAKGGKE